MSLFTELSFFTQLSIGSTKFQFVAAPPAPFNVNGVNYIGSVTLSTSGSDFVVDQANDGVNNFHRIKVGDIQFLASYTTPAIANLAANTFQNNLKFSTSNTETRFCFVSAPTGSYNSSTVNLMTTSSFYACVMGTNQYLSINTFGQLVFSTQGTLMTIITAPSAANSIGGGGALPVDPAGNPIIANGSSVDFTATTQGPVLGAYNTGVLMPGYPRDNCILIDGGSSARWFPYTSPGAPPNQSNIGSNNWLNSGSPANLDSNVADSIALSDNQVLVAGFIGTAQIVLYDTLGVPGTPIVTDAPNNVGFTVAINTDASIIAYTGFVSAHTDTVYIYVIKKIGNTWQQVAKSAGVTSTGISATTNQSFSMSKDGRTISLCNYYGHSGQVLVAFEDTSSDGSWSTSTLTDLTTHITFGPSNYIHATCVSPEGLYIVAAMAPNIVLYFKKVASGWSVLFQYAIQGYAGPNLGVIKASYRADDVFVSTLAISGTRVGFTLTKFTDTLLFAVQLSCPVGPIYDMAVNSNASGLLMLSNDSNIYMTSFVQNNALPVSTLVVHNPSNTTAVVLNDNCASPACGLVNSQIGINIISTYNPNNNNTYISASAITPLPPVGANDLRPTLGTSLSTWENVFFPLNLINNVVFRADGNPLTVTSVTSGGAVSIFSNVVNINGEVQYSGLAAGGVNSVFSMTFGYSRGIPPPVPTNTISGVVKTGTVAFTAGAANLTLAGGLNCFCAFDGTNLTLLQQKNDGTDVQLNADQTNPPYVNAAGTISFNITYNFTQ